MTGATNGNLQHLKRRLAEHHMRLDDNPSRPTELPLSPVALCTVRRRWYWRQPLPVEAIVCCESSNVDNTAGCCVSCLACRLSLSQVLWAAVSSCTTELADIEFPAHFLTRSLVKRFLHRKKGGTSKCKTITVASIFIHTSKLPFPYPVSSLAKHRRDYKQTKINHNKFVPIRNYHTLRNSNKLRNDPPHPHQHRPHPHHIILSPSPYPPGCLYSVIILFTSFGFTYFFCIYFWLQFLLCRPL